MRRAEWQSAAMRAIEAVHGDGDALGFEWLEYGRAAGKRWGVVVVTASGRRSLWQASSTAPHARDMFVAVVGGGDGGRS